jgi:methionyl-tRNA formyltransferase
MKDFNSLRIIFFGTPDFAVASLRALVDAGANIVSVVTAPDKPAGRGMQLQSSAVKQFATEHGLPVLQPEKLKNPEFVQQLRDLNADLHIVVAFRMLPEVVWNMPPLGTVNVHGSLLPQYRGAAPINWAIINGETETGVTTFRLKHEIDTGDILLQKRLPILPEDNIGTLYNKLMHIGGELLVETVRGLAEGSIKEQPQDAIADAELKHAPKIFKEHTVIDWNQPAGSIHNLVRGLSPHPAAITKLEGKVLKLYQVHSVGLAPGQEPGTVDSDGKTYLRFATTDGWVYIEELQLEGKKKMDVISFLRGYRIAPLAG